MADEQDGVVEKDRQGQSPDGTPGEARTEPSNGRLHDDAASGPQPASESREHDGTSSGAEQHAEHVESTQAEPEKQAEALASDEPSEDDGQNEPIEKDEQDESLGQVALVEHVKQGEQSATDELAGQDEPAWHEPIGQAGQARRDEQVGADRQDRQNEPLGQVGPVGQGTDDAEIESEGGAIDGLRASAELKAILEALIFASPDPLTRKAIGKLLTSEPAEDIDAALAELKIDYERPGGLQLVEVAGGYQIVTRSDLHEWVRRLFHERTTQKLTVQALETLAVIAYRQPVTALEVTEIRGVTAAGVLNTLLERHLIKIVGRKKVVGRPFLYATTKEFLIRFGLNEINDLPKVEDMAEALGFEPPLLTEHAPVEEALPLEEPDLEPDEPSDEEPSDEEPSKIH